MLRKIRILPLLVVLCRPLAAEERAATLRFELSFPPTVRTEPADGRVFVILTRKAEPEPRLQFGKSGGQYRSTPFFGEDVDALKPGQRAVIGGRSIGYPVERLADLPAGDYYVQGMLNVYTTFHRADGHVVKMHMDQWEGQNFPVSPGNLYSEPRKIHVDPAVERADPDRPRSEDPADRDAEGHGVGQARALREPAAFEVLGAPDLHRRDDPAAEGLRPRLRGAVPGQLRAGALFHAAAGRIRGDAPSPSRTPPSGKRRVLAGRRNSRRPGSRARFRGCCS